MFFASLFFPFFPDFDCLQHKHTHTNTHTLPRFECERVVVISPILFDNDDVSWKKDVKPSLSTLSTSLVLDFWSLLSIAGWKTSKAPK